MIHRKEIVRSTSARNRATQPLDASLSTETRHPGCFAPTNMCFLSPAKPLFIVRALFQHLNNPENEKNAGYTYMSFIKIGC